MRVERFELRVGRFELHRAPPDYRQFIDAAASGPVGVDGFEDFEVGVFVLIGGVPFQAEDLGE